MAKDFSAQYKDRRYDEMFYADDEALTVGTVQAFVCPPNDDDTRWVPEKGYSVSVGGTLFKTEREAKAKLHEKAAKERQRLLARLAKLDATLMTASPAGEP
jgi:hypothetical protein